MISGDSTASTLHAQPPGDPGQARESPPPRQRRRYTTATAGRQHRGYTLNEPSDAFLGSRWLTDFGLPSGATGQLVGSRCLTDLWPRDGGGSRLAH
jgi:hypothetical protein